MCVCVCKLILILAFPLKCNLHVSNVHYSTIEFLVHVNKKNTFNVCTIVINNYLYRTHSIFNIN